MSQSQYLKFLEKEIHNINKIIDRKILRGEEYSEESRNHKLLMRKVRYMQKKSFFQRLFPVMFQFS
ncbi:hypothetical protein K8Q94_02170 [Candidatus Nomurabacteria bacterium]|nr:hypothetical protein [Candidatus Nomurabacteria bacterium]